MDTCFEKTPFMSLIAFVLVFFGSGVICSTVYDAIRRIERVFQDTFYTIDYVSIIQVITISFSVFTMIYAIAMVVIGATNTGETRDKINRKKPFPTQNKRGLRLHILFSYLLLLLWVSFFILMCLPVIIWTVLTSICYHELTYWRNRENKDKTEFNYVFSLKNYALYKEDIDRSLENDKINDVDGFTRFCSEIYSIGPMFGCAAIAVVFVIFGINTFIACLNAAVVRLKYLKELNTFRSALSKEPGQQILLESNSSNPVPINSTMDTEKLAALNTQLTMQRNSYNTAMPSYGYGNSPYASHYQSHYVKHGTINPKLCNYPQTNVGVTGAGEGTYGTAYSLQSQPLLHQTGHYRNPSKF